MKTQRKRRCHLSLSKMAKKRKKSKIMKKAAMKKKNEENEISLCGFES